MLRRHSELIKNAPGVSGYAGIICRSTRVPRLLRPFTRPGYTPISNCSPSSLSATDGRPALLGRAWAGITIVHQTQPREAAIQGGGGRSNHQDLYDDLRFRTGGRQEESRRLNIAAWKRRLVKTPSPRCHGSILTDHTLGSCVWRERSKDPGSACLPGPRCCQMNPANN